MELPMLEQLQSLTQRISHADLSVQNIGNCDYVLDAPYARYYRFRFTDGFYEVGSYERHAPDSFSFQTRDETIALYQFTRIIGGLYRSAQSYKQLATPSGWAALQLGWTVERPDKAFRWFDVTEVNDPSMHFSTSEPESHIILTYFMSFSLDSLIDIFLDPSGGELGTDHRHIHALSF